MQNFETISKAQKRLLRKKSSFKFGKMKSVFVVAFLFFISVGKFLYFFYLLNLDDIVLCLHARSARRLNFERTKVKGALSGMTVLKSLA